MYSENKESPGRAGALGPYEELSSFLDTPILSQTTIQARRGSPSAAFSEPEIDHFVMAITAAEATVRHTTLPSNGLSCRNVWMADMSCIWLCIGAACAGFFAGGLLVLLMARLPIDKPTAL